MKTQNIKFSTKDVSWENVISKIDEKKIKEKLNNLKIFDQEISFVENLIITQKFKLKKARIELNLENTEYLNSESIVGIIDSVEISIPSGLISGPKILNGLTSVIFIFFP